MEAGGGWIPKRFFYAYYPAHLLAIYLIGLVV